MVIFSFILSIQGYLAGVIGGEQKHVRGLFKNSKQPGRWRFKDHGQILGSWVYPGINLNDYQGPYGRGRVMKTNRLSCASLLVVLRNDTKCPTIDVY